jgi:hypothetical protein
MSNLDSLKIIGEVGDYSIGLIGDAAYNPASADNIVSYNKFYSDNSLSEHYSTQHGVFILEDMVIVNSACVSSSGGHTGVHAHSCVLENDRLLICCANKIFCLTVPELGLLWRMEADPATCFGIFEFGDGYIIHGELEISRLDKGGNKIWRFLGSDIFTTLSGKDDFKVEAGVV